MANCEWSPTVLAICVVQNADGRLQHQAQRKSIGESNAVFLMSADRDAATEPRKTGFSAQKWDCRLFARGILGTHNVIFRRQIFTEQLPRTAGFSHAQITNTG